MTEQKEALFDLGVIIASPKYAELQRDPAELLSRHETGDHGDAEGWGYYGMPILSEYDGVKVLTFIDRSKTLIFFADETEWALTNV